MSAQDIFKLNPAQVDQQKKVIQSIVEKKAFKELKEALISLVNDVSKQNLAVSLFKSLEDFYIEVEENVMEDIATTLLEIFKNKSNPAFNRAEYKLRIQLADININVKGNFDKGIQYLQESCQQQDRLGKNMELSEKKELHYETVGQIAYQYFQNDKSEYCRQWIQELSSIGSYIQEFEQTLQTEEQKKKYEERLKSLKTQKSNYLYLKANEEDSKKNFLRAAKLYLAFVRELNPTDASVQSNLIEALDAAVICTVLSQSGDLKTNLVAQLYQDKNIEKSNHHQILYKTHQKRLITEQDKAKLVEQLKPHQKAEDDTYQVQTIFTIYEKAIIEHNIVACTQLYETISLDSLATKLLLNNSDTELILQSMIAKGTLNAKIDQITNFITFSSDEQIPVDFNSKILTFCGKVNDYLEQIQRQKK